MYMTLFRNLNKLRLENIFNSYNLKPVLLLLCIIIIEDEYNFKIYCVKIKFFRFLLYVFVTDYFYKPIKYIVSIFYLLESESLYGRYLQYIVITYNSYRFNQFSLLI